MVKLYRISYSTYLIMSNHNFREEDLNNNVPIVNDEDRVSKAAGGIAVENTLNNTLGEPRSETKHRPRVTEFPKRHARVYERAERANGLYAASHRTG